MWTPAACPSIVTTGWPPSKAFHHTNRLPVIGQHRIVEWVGFLRRRQAAATLVSA
jgi:hypothetical protein